METYSLNQVIYIARRILGRPVTGKEVRRWLSKCGWDKSKDVTPQILNRLAALCLLTKDKPRRHTTLAEIDAYTEQARNRVADLFLRRMVIEPVASVTAWEDVPAAIAELSLCGFKPSASTVRKWCKALKLDHGQNCPVETLVSLATHADVMAERKAAIGGTSGEDL